MIITIRGVNRWKSLNNSERIRREEDISRGMGVRWGCLYRKGGEIFLEGWV
jgi:hypothetical protein